MGTESPDMWADRVRGSWIVSGDAPSPSVPFDPAEPVVDLQICPACGSGLVHPVEWERADSMHWHVELRCPECEWNDASVHPQHVLDRFDEALDLATDSLVEDLRRLQRVNMEHEVDRFTAALSAGLILPEDF